MKSMRDIFWDEIYERARLDRNIMLVAADMGAPALDKFRRDLQSQFINTGIAEQNAISIAAGLALSGKKVFVYAIAPFITYRCYDQTKVMLSGMNIPVTLVGIGAGFSYDDSGPTHHTVEDISVMRILPHMTVHTPYTADQTKFIANFSCDMKTPNYVRLDRQHCPDFKLENLGYMKGFSIVKPLQKFNIVSIGNLTSIAIEAVDILQKEGINVGIVNLFAIPCVDDAFSSILKNTDQIMTVEEHTLPGGLGSYILESISDLHLPLAVKRIGLDFSEGYCYEYGGRARIDQKYGLSVAKIVETVKSLM
jgi:transketolase